MPRPIPLPVRQMIRKRFQQGHTPAAIAQQLGLPPRTVRHLLQRFADEESRLAPDYERCGRPPKQQPRPVITAALQLRQQHPTWGAGLIRVMLTQSKEYRHQQIPCQRTLERWLARLGEPPAPPGRRPDVQRDRAERPHDVWQVDAADQMRLGSGCQASWLRAVDECSGAVLGTVVFREGNWGQVPPAETQRVMRDWFRQWGMPARLRVDNGIPWGSWSDLPPDLALWVLGLGIGMIWNPPRRPQENGVVERSQGTGKRWAEPKACENAEELQQHINQMDTIQRESYPVHKGQSRQALYPSLAHSGRRYTKQWEQRHWDLAPVLAHLAGYAVTRRVDKSGRVSVYNRGYYVGPIHQGKTVYVMFDADSSEWFFADEEGRHLNRQRAKEIVSSSIQSLSVTRRPPVPRRQSRKAK